MTAILFLLTFVVIGQVGAEVIQLKCSDNATCIENMAKEFVRSMRQKKTVTLFDVVTIEPLKTRQARSNQGLLSSFLQNHAFTFDWDDWSFRLTKPEERNDAMEVEIFESRTAKDVSETNPKKSNSKVEEDQAEDKSSKGIRNTTLTSIRRRRRRKVIQAVIPLLFGMKSAGVVIFALALVTVLTLKAFVASKLALFVTVGIALKKLYESYGTGVGLQNHPYLYSQYPIDFPSASSHAYSVNGVSPQFASPEMFNPTALAAHSHTHELLQQNDVSAQQSQQAPSLQLINATRASERWDGFRRRPMFYGPSRATSESYLGYQGFRH